MDEDKEAARIKEMQEKLVKDFQWSDEEESPQHLPGFEEVQRIIDCAYELLNQTEKQLDLKYFQGNLFSVPLSVYSHELLEQCFDCSYSSESQATFLECLYSVYAGIANVPHFKEELGNKINTLLPCDDTKYCFQVEQIILTDNPDCPMLGTDRDERDPALIQGEDDESIQSVVAEIHLTTVRVPEENW